LNSEAAAFAQAYSGQVESNAEGSVSTLTGIGMNYEKVLTNSER